MPLAFEEGISAMQESRKIANKAEPHRDKRSRLRRSFSAAAHG